MEIQPRNLTAKGPAEWFTGDVWIDAVAQGHGPSPVSIGSVHFAPGARTAWLIERRQDPARREPRP